MIRNIELKPGKYRCEDGQSIPIVIMQCGDEATITMSASDAVNVGDAILACSEIAVQRLCESAVQNELDTFQIDEEDEFDASNN